ncbi:MAG TPA: inositol monophosphatase family protein [Thermomicrobiales bacterium]|nr:inositol monophosphatase family protein [Thermomicrobiales bacterium]
MPEPNLDELVSVAVDIARDAGAILRDRFDRPHDIQFKAAVDMVTEADRASEALIAERLRARYPTHRLLGEEGARGAAESEAASPYRWVVDPLDGTTNFAHGMPGFAVSIGLEYEGTPIVGVVFDPIHDELYVARQGGGATLNGTQLQVSAVPDLLRSLLATGFSYDLAKRPTQAEIWLAFLTRVQAIRQTGSSALNLCSVAAGRLDGYWEDAVSPWDVAAGVLMVREAGGAVSRYGGEPFASDDGNLVASNGLIHQAMLAVLGATTPG